MRIAILRTGEDWRPSFFVTRNDEQDRNTGFLEILMLPTTFKAVIVRAGPAGLTAEYKLSEQGASRSSGRGPALACIGTTNMSRLDDGHAHGEKHFRWRAQVRRLGGEPERRVP